jgi:hypothetical protein
MRKQDRKKGALTVDKSGFARLGIDSPRPFRSIPAQPPAASSRLM